MLRTLKFKISRKISFDGSDEREKRKETKVGRKHFEMCLRRVFILYSVWQSLVQI